MGEKVARTSGSQRTLASVTIDEEGKLGVFCAGGIDPRILFLDVLRVLVLSETEKGSPIVRAPGPLPKARRGG